MFGSTAASTGPKDLQPINPDHDPRLRVVCIIIKPCHETADGSEGGRVNCAVDTSWKRRGQSGYYVFLVICIRFLSTSSTPATCAILGQKRAVRRGQQTPLALLFPNHPPVSLFFDFNEYENVGYVPFSFFFFPPFELTMPLFLLRLFPLRRFRIRRENSNRRAWEEKVW